MEPNNAPQRRARNLVTRADGKLVNVARKTGQLFVCAKGCCCGLTEHGFPAVPEELYHNEWMGRGLRNKVHLSMGGCLGPCPLANVVMLLFDGRSLWFHSFSSDRQVLDLFDYIEAMLAAQSYLPPPPALVPYHFTAFNWDDLGEAHPVRPAASAVEASGFLWLTQSDTEALALAQVAARLDPDFPPLRVHNISHLQTDADVDAFLNQHLPQAEVVVLRLLGGRSSFGHGFDHVVAHAAEHDTWLLCLPGTDTLDPEMTAHSNAGVPVTHEVLAYLQLGGLKNYEHALRFLADHLLTTGFGYDAPAPQPRHGVYHPDVPEGTLAAWSQRSDPAKPTIGVLFYRSHLLSGNTAFVDALVRAGETAGANVLPVYAYSLKEYDEAPQPTDTPDESPQLQPLRLTDIEREQLKAMLGEFADDVLDDADEDDGLEQALDEAPPPPLPAALTYFDPANGWPADVLVCTMSFAMGGADASVADGDWSVEVLHRLDVPVLQAITASMGREQWQASSRGLTPLDTAMNVAIPEFDGRIITVPVSFKQEAPLAGVTGGAPVVHYAPDEERVRRVIGQALRLVALRRTPPEQRRVAFVLTNYSAKASRIANAVGLDSPASLLHLLQRMRDAGYRIGELPPDGDALMQHLIDRGSYDLDELTEAQMANAVATVPAGAYAGWFGNLPAANQAEMAAKWGQPPGEHYVDSARGLFLAGVEYGNAFVAIQPPRGYGMDPTAIYHMPDLAPPHPYHALYRWLSLPQAEGGWGADAVVHLGKHGTLEWLPGKGIGVSAECYPDLFLGDLPLVYPFIINNPGEGAQAKRRTHAVVIDHMTPPMTTAEGYGELEELQRLVDEYYQMEQLDPTKLPLLQQQIWALIRKARLDNDLGRMLNFDSAAHTHEWDPQFHEDGVPYTISDLTGRDFAHLVENINGYLCELTSAQIRDGLHVLGQPPEGDQLVDTLLALVRLPNLQVPSLRAGIAACFGLSLDAVLDDLGARCDAPAALASIAQRPLPTNADLLRAIDDIAEYAMLMLAAADFRPEALATVLPAIFWPWTPDHAGATTVDRTLDFVCRQLAPNLRRIDGEVTNLLHALEGGFVPPGPSGAPTRGMAHVLPTGRNFYAVDPRALPSMAAWEVGRQLADGVLQKHLADEGAYPESVGISIWGTSAMRTHGDDVAEVLALLGVRPVWAAESRRVTGVEVIPLSELGRPRIDVLCRISGFFRDAFPHLIALLDDAVRLVASLDEPLDQNHVRAHALREQQRLTAQGMPEREAATLAGYRVFGSKPGAYGAGILPLIDERNWSDAADFAEAYVNWGGYAYTAQDYGVDAREAFKQVLGGVQVAVKNQDNREHDIFDSDDYLQYHGGMIATIRALTGKNPRRYFGDNADPQRAKVRDLGEEALRVFRSRVVNPKWIAGVQRHGYKGALELAATVDYLFGYDATSGVMEDWMYAKVAETYALDPAMQQFMQESNPWALRDIAARLLEAADRDLWHEPGDLRYALTQTYLDTEAALEGRGAPSPKAGLS